MAKLKVSQDEVIGGLMEVFRSVGYEGASLEELAKATGLKKSSLYHRFPGGKEQMAREVLKYSDQWIKDHIVSELNKEGDPEQRLKRAVNAIDQLYRGGEEACILRALSLEKGLSLFSSLINNSFRELIDGFTKLAIDIGHSKPEGKKIAAEVLIKIQGGLILSKGIDEPKLFQRILKEIKVLYIR